MSALKYSPQPLVGSNKLKLTSQVTRKPKPRSSSSGYSSNLRTPRPKKELGDAIESALSRIGITEDRVSKWLGRPCNCKERRSKLNSLSRWAKSLLKGKVDKTKAETILEEMIADEV